MENSNTENKHAPNILTINDNDVLFNVENLIIYNSDKWKVLNSQCFDRIKVAVRIYFYKMALAVCHRTGIVRAGAGSPPTSWLTLHSLWSASYLQSPTGCPRGWLCPAPSRCDVRSTGSHGHSEELSRCQSPPVVQSDPQYHSQAPRVGVSILNYPTPSYNLSYK